MTRAMKSEPVKLEAREGWTETNYEVHHDGTRVPGNVRRHPTVYPPVVGPDDPPGTVYGPSGLVDIYSTALEQKRRKTERKTEAEVARGRSSAAKRKLERQVRDREMGDFAFKLAQSDDLADQLKKLPSVVTERWNAREGTSLSESTVRRILKEQKVASRFRDR